MLPNLYRSSHLYGTYIYVCVRVLRVYMKERKRDTKLTLFTIVTNPINILLIFFLVIRVKLYASAMEPIFNYQYINLLKNKIKNHTILHMYHIEPLARHYMVVDIYNTIF